MEPSNDLISLSLCYFLFYKNNPSFYFSELVISLSGSIDFNSFLLGSWLQHDWKSCYAKKVLKFLLITIFLFYLSYLWLFCWQVQNWHSWLYCSFKSCKEVFERRRQGCLFFWCPHVPVHRHKYMKDYVCIFLYWLLVNSCRLRLLWTWRAVKMSSEIVLLSLLGVFRMMLERYLCLSHMSNVFILLSWCLFIFCRSTKF